MRTAQKYNSFESFLESFLEKYQTHLKLALPLGLAKPNQLTNLIYDHFKKNPQKKLEIFSALSLSLPKAKSEMEARFLNPFVKKHFGENYPELEYVKAISQHRLPSNISVYEFYYQAGVYAAETLAQRNFVSLNYTFAAEHIFQKEIDVIVQLVARHPHRGTYSLSSNPDMILDVVDKYREASRPLKIVGVVHPELPFMEGDAEVDESFFDVLIETKELDQPLFALPKNYVDEVDHLIGWHASQLVEDGGTLQIGIGSLSDALVHSMLFRHQNNSEYSKLRDLWWNGRGVLPRFLHTGVFEKGLYGTSEMIMDGFMHLRRAGVLKRTVKDFSQDIQRFLHGAFYLGSKEFYQWLKDLPESERHGIGMTRVSKINDLYDEDEMALRRQRQKARFFNTGLMATVFGEVMSDTLENGQVVSGVGGQYNFVAMSHELPDSRSILMIRSTRGEGKNRTSNILWNGSRVTIPRHLRDIIITEYGIADLKYKTDEQVIRAMIEITDSQFQESLRVRAVAAGKLDPEYRIPTWAQNNTPGKIVQFVQSAQGKAFYTFPFGSDFTKIEESLIRALMALKTSVATGGKWSLILSGMRESDDSYRAELERMDFMQARGLKNYLLKSALKGALKSVK